jgi:hypothetical protein
LQDLASLLRGKKRIYRKPHNVLRALSFVLAICIAALGSSSLASWIDPWSLFGRFFTYDLRPIVGLANREDLLGLNAVSVVTATVAMAAVLAASFLNGRWFCGNLCPVGGALGVLNHFALLRVRLESSASASPAASAPRSAAQPAWTPQPRVSNQAAASIALHALIPARRARFITEST